MRIRPLLPYIGSILIILFLLWLIDWQDILNLLVGTDPRWLLIGCGWYVITNILRAYRFSVLFGKDKINQPIQILPEMFALSFLNNVLPSRTGELSFPYFMQKRHNIPIGEGTTALLIARIFDLLTVLVLYIIFSLVELQNLPSSAASIIGTVALAGFVIASGLMVAPWLANFGIKIFQTIVDRLRWHEQKAIRLLLRIANDVAGALGQMRSVVVYAQTFAWSIAIWLTTFAWFDAFLRAIDVPMRYTLVVIGATFASIAKALPFVSIGGFGAHEAGWTIGFSLVGMEQSFAISTGFAVNLLTLMVSIAFGGVCSIAMHSNIEHLWRSTHDNSEYSHK